MRTEAELAKTVRATLTRLGVAETALEASKTIHDPARLVGTTSSLPPLALAGADLVSIREIGRGGMGVVHLAEQRSLAREVAVKTAASTDARVIGALVREARIMGALEHPSLVPIHSLGVDANGAPMLVMKRIDGVTWRELMDAPDHPAWAPLVAGHGDKLRAQIDILAHVSRALAFAHDRGIVHRDLKPENVMVGRFGEVYVLDWGAALRLSERATEIPALVGTPGYLAPEMVSGDPTLVDARTDVYLLGATLFEMLTGRMPHAGASAMTALMHALSGELPALPEGAPADLCDLVRKAMAADKSDRLPSAEAFREVLARFLVSRHADIVVADARAALGRASALAASEGAASAHAFRALVEARFGFAAAQRILPHDESIRGELDASVIRLVEREIAARSPATARTFLAELTRAPPDLVSRVDALDGELEVEKRAAEEGAKMKREADISKMVRPLSVILVIMTIIGVGLGVHYAAVATTSTNGFPVPQAIALDTLLYSILGIGVLIARRALFGTAVSRRLILIYLVGATGVFASELVTFALGRGTIDATAHSITMVCVIIGSVGAAGVRRVLVALPVAVICVGGILTHPRFAPVFAIIALVATVPVFIWAFRAQASTLAEYIGQSKPKVTASSSLPARRAGRTFRRTSERRRCGSRRTDRAR